MKQHTPSAVVLFRFAPQGWAIVKHVQTGLTMNQTRDWTGIPDSVSRCHSRLSSLSRWHMTVPQHNPANTLSAHKGFLSTPIIWLWKVYRKWDLYLQQTVVTLTGQTGGSCLDKRHVSTRYWWEFSRGRWFKECRGHSEARGASPLWHWANQPSLRSC